MHRSNKDDSSGGLNGNASTTKTEPAAHRKSLFIRSIKVNIPIQLVLGVFAAVATDRGGLFQIWYFTMTSYWALITLIWVLHRNRLSKIDVFLVKWGFWLALMITPIATTLFWRLYGYI
jgi:hypothetical protein